MSNLTSKVISVLAVLLLLVYAGYQVYRYVYTPYRTETAYEYTVTDTLQCEGLVVRDEILLTGGGSGSIIYSVEEGDKVKQGTEIIRYFENDQQARNAAHVELLDQEIALLKRVQDPGSYIYANTESLTGQVNELLGQIEDITSKGSAEGLPEIRNHLLETLCKRQLSVEAVSGFDDRIHELELEREDYLNTESSNTNCFYAPVSGYFSRYSDGCENLFSSEKFFEMSVSELADAIQQEYPLTDQTAGKIMTQHNWYCAMILPLEDGERFSPGLQVTVSFESESISNISMEVYQVKNEEETGNSIVILQSKEIVPGILSARSVFMKVQFATYTGLRVSDGAVRLVDGQIGVYVSTGYDIRFKPIEVLYQGDGYQICNINYNTENGLNMFDQVVVKGTDLYDGKPLL